LEFFEAISQVSERRTRKTLENNDKENTSCICVEDGWNRLYQCMRKEDIARQESFFEM